MTQLVSFTYLAASTPSAPPVPPHSMPIFPYFLCLQAFVTTTNFRPPVLLGALPPMPRSPTSQRPFTLTYSTHNPIDVHPPHLALSRTTLAPASLYPRKLKYAHPTFPYPTLSCSRDPFQFFRSGVQSGARFPFSISPDTQRTPCRIPPALIQGILYSMVPYQIQRSLRCPIYMSHCENKNRPTAHCTMTPAPSYDIS